MEKTIRIYGAEKSTQDGKKFIKWSYTKDGKKFYEVHFTKECAVPSKRGYYLVTVDLKDVNIKKSKQKTFTNDETGEVITIQPNDIMWVKQVNKFVSDTEYEAELEKKRLDDLSNIL